ncbi:recombinase family protein [Nonomuraea muscovyensis]|uniref:recombinase family protein n=1 Tax=Nonomuraea muscovyensis TaxID=1124761 RepID=UPI0033D84B5B
MRAVVDVIGLVRVSTDKQNTQRQHDALDPICLKVFEEKISGKLGVEEPRNSHWR